MALDTYPNLTAAVQAVMADTTSIVTGPVDDWVRLCEQRLFYGYGTPEDKFYSPPLRCRQLETPFTLRLEQIQDGGTSGGSANAQTVTLSAAPTLALGLTVRFVAGFSNTGAMTLNANGTGNVNVKKGVNNNDLEQGDVILGATYSVYHDGTQYKLLPHLGSAPLPASCLAFKSIYDEGTDEQPLDVFGPAQISGLLGVNESGSPIQAYSLSGDYVRFFPLPDSTRFIKGIYYKKPASLSTTISQLYRDAPSVYLWGTMLEGAIWLSIDEWIPKFYESFRAAVAGVARSSRADRAGGSPRIMRPYGPVV